MQTRLPFFGIVCVSGEDCASFLHNQLSNDIINLQTAHACYATYNSPKGRVLANMLVLNRGDDFLLLMAADLQESIIKRLRMFVLRAKVEFTSLNDFSVAAQLNDHALASPANEPKLSLTAQYSNEIWHINLPHTGSLWVGATSQLPPYNVEAENKWNIHEIYSGYPWISNATKETAVAQMLNQHIIGGIHFRKGCYPGQEIIARAQYRGQVKRGLAVLSSNFLKKVGDIIYAEGEEAGVILNTAVTALGSINLVMMKFSAANKELIDLEGNILHQEQLFFTADIKI